MGKLLWMNILVVGKGGREHALIRAFSESASAPRIFCYPGSDAIAKLATIVEGVSNVVELVAWMQRNQIDLCVAGEESYLVQDRGLANLCAEAGIACWGPYKEAAQLEASKSFAKEFMERHAIPTGKAAVVTSSAEAQAEIAEHYPCVLKFDGLAAGKGVAVCETREQADAFLDEVFEQRRFGEGQLLVEQYLQGPEVSIFAAVVDEQYLIFTPARDYQRVADGDQGPNTGGMGAVASRELIDSTMLQRIEREIIAPTVAGLVEDDLRYRGFLYFGLMLTAAGPKVIEYNCRFGDPECQAVMPLVKGDLAAFCLAGARGDFQPSLLQFESGWSLCVVLASAGYPAGASRGDVILGLESVARVDHAATRMNAQGRWETNGGRVLAVVAGGETREQAVAAVYEEADKVSFTGMQRRRDIGILHFES